MSLFPIGPNVPVPAWWYSLSPRSHSSTGVKLEAVGKVTLTAANINLSASEDPAHPGTDHTREYAPLLAVVGENGSIRHDGPLADVGASALAWLAGLEDDGLPGTPFL